MLKKKTTTTDFPPPEIKLGDYVRDTISGFEGIVVCRTEWLYQCVRIGVAHTSLDKDGKVVDTEWFDEGQLEITVKPDKVEVKPPVPNAPLTGGPRDAPKRHPDPVR